MIYQRINNVVDLTVACRWLDSSNGVATAAASVEMLIHNRSNGETCFFSAKDTGVNPEPVTTPAVNRPVSTAIVSPTNFNISLQKGYLNANDYWLQPTDLNNKVLPYGNTNVADPSQITYDSARCVGCHSAGPYIASPRIVSYLAQFGLINNGHDTVADMTAANHYHAVGSGTYNFPLIPLINAFGAWDAIIYNNLNGYNSALGVTVDPKNECSTGCHSIAYNSAIHSLTELGEGAPLLPSIQDDLAEITNAQFMPPTNDPYSDYRWINRSNAGGSGEYELLSSTLNDNRYSKLVCTSPTELQAHVVGSRDIFSTRDSFPDNLHTFNMQDGLLCLNSEQSDGHQCNDWALRYKCNGTWTDWINNDRPWTGKGDYERRSDPAYANVCSSPTEMQATTLSSGAIFTAPNDRLYAFSPSYGLGCHHADQPNGHCANYVVRFICPN